MEQNKLIRKRREVRPQAIYSRSSLTRKIVVPFKCVGKNIEEVIEENIKNTLEGKCEVEGYIKPDSAKIISISNGTLQRGNLVAFDVLFECLVCYPVEGMLISGVVKNLVKAGIMVESENETPSPFVAFVAKDHHFNSANFNEIKIGDIVNIRVIGQRFELGDTFISIVGEYIKDKDLSKKPFNATKQPRLNLEV